MKFNVQVILDDFDDKPLVHVLKADKDGVILEKEPWTLGAAIIEVLMLNSEDDKSMPGTVKQHNGELARKVHKRLKKDSDGLINLKAEDITTIKERIGKFFGPGMVVAAYEFLDGDVDTLTDEQREKKLRKEPHEADVVEPQKDEEKTV